MGMDIPAEPVSVNGSEVRGRTSSTEKNYSRDTSMSSTQLSVIYHERKANNDMDVNPEPANNCPALFYKTEQEKALCFSKATETLGNTRPPIPTLNMFSTLIKANDLYVTQYLMMITAMSLTYSSYMIQILLLNQTFGVVAST